MRDRVEKTEKLKDAMETYLWLRYEVFLPIMILSLFGMFLSVGIFVVGVVIFNIHWLIVVPIIIIEDIVVFYFIIKFIKERQRLYGDGWVTPWWR